MSLLNCEVMCNEIVESLCMAAMLIRENKIKFEMEGTLGQVKLLQNDWENRMVIVKKWK